VISALGFRTLGAAAAAAVLVGCTDPEAPGETPTVDPAVVKPLSRQSRLVMRAKNLAERVLNRGAVQPVDWNRVREEYNDLLRDEYGESGRLFDPAMLEAGPRDTSDAVASSDSRCLRDEYTSDGGHLNGVGRRHIGRELLLFLSRLEG
jgi:hypothetical protein